MTMPRKEKKLCIPAWLIIKYPGMQIMGALPSKTLAEKCAEDIYKDKSVCSVQIKSIDLSDLDMFIKLITSIQSDIYCDVCGGRFQCFCVIFGLTEYITTINTRTQKIKLERFMRSSTGINSEYQYNYDNLSLGEISKSFITNMKT